MKCVEGSEQVRYYYGEVFGSLCIIDEVLIDNRSIRMCIVVGGFIVILGLRKKRGLFIYFSEDLRCL